MGAQVRGVITGSGNAHGPDTTSHHIAAQQIVGSELLIVVLIESRLGHNHSGDS